MEQEQKETAIENDETIDPVSSNNNTGRKRRQKWLFGILAIGIVIGSFYGIRWLHYYFTHAITDDATVEGDLISVSSTVSGKIRLLPIQEGEKLKQGQLIAQLREEDYRAKVDVASGVVQSIKASLNEAMADEALVKQTTEKDVQRAEAALYASQARLKEAQANLQLATLDFNRVSKLFKSKTVSASEMDKIRAAYQLAKARAATADEEINENRAKLNVAQANTGEVRLKQRRVESLKGKLKEAEAELEAARLKLDHTTVTSPIDGVVARKISHIGEVVAAGQPIAVIVNLNHIWVEANLEETQVEHVRLGQSVDIQVDAYPDTKFTGKVINIGAAAASQFALIPDNRSAGNFTKVTQRIPIKIELDDPDKPLRPGMMVEVGIDIRKTQK
ncbi:MAG: HlyD family secretion protein [Desulfobacterales bacterium]|jgi:membrane fusion protein (multidrug efflux system)|nr:HlyD family secretion protein [Desulfobacterales bacterium]